MICVYACVHVCVCVPVLCVFSWCEYVFVVYGSGGKEVREACVGNAIVDISFAVKGMRRRELTCTPQIWPRKEQLQKQNEPKEKATKRKGMN
jgi:hypothetical protein